jgi:hypothetical protein
LHILNNELEYGNADQAIQLLKSCNKAKKWTAVNHFTYKFSNRKLTNRWKESQPT